jgi:hydrogenase-4 membrane subunit HyfE
MHTATTATQPPSAKPAGTVRRRWLPPQHGAWAMLAVPYLAGLLAAGYQWPDLALAVAWLTGYLLSYFVFQTIKTRRPARHRNQILLYAAIATAMTAVVVAARPAILWYAPAYAALFAVNTWYAARRRERALLNDLASVLQSCLIVLVVTTIAGQLPAAGLNVFVLCLAYFTGTVFYVKTMIRERGNRAYRRWSIGYHAVAVPVAAWVSPWSAALFGWLLLRAVLLPGRGWSPKRTGLVEIVNCLLLLGCAALL